MTKNQKPQATKLATNGQQTITVDGSQILNDGFQMMADYEQRGLSVPIRGNHNPGYGRQTPSTTPTAPTSPQRTFVPASGPKIPPMKK